MIEPAVNLPKWTVHYNIVSPEGSDWIGTGWEFFATEEQANQAYKRHLNLGNVPGKRPFHHWDQKHLGASHRWEIDHRD